MRLKFSGTAVTSLPPVILKLANSTLFVPQQYIDLGYVNYDVICIGGGGGRAGVVGLQPFNASASTPATTRTIAGGGGGGGGIHRVQGLLSSLASTVAIVSGAQGSIGTDHGTTIASTTAGGDGGASSFGSTICRASGGKGGLVVTGASVAAGVPGVGGQGGLGNSATAGGGAVGATASVAAGGGTWNGSIGSGGGGGRGGANDISDTSPPPTTLPLNGSYGAYDITMEAYCPERPTGWVRSVGMGSSQRQFIIPQCGGGGNAWLFTGVDNYFGKGAQQVNQVDSAGAVYIKLTGNS